MSNIIKEIPCKTCILLAICQYKEEVECKWLFRWHRQTRGYRIKTIKELLPKLTAISKVQKIDANKAEYFKRKINLKVDEFYQEVTYI